MKPQVPEGHRVRYTHVRYEDEAGNVLPRGGQTVAAVYPEGSDTPVAIAAAWCCALDNYNKRIGRHIALGRAIKRLP
jgi:hypothetical protein